MYKALHDHHCRTHQCLKHHKQQMWWCQLKMRWNPLHKNKSYHCILCSTNWRNQNINLNRLHQAYWVTGSIQKKKQSSQLWCKICRKSKAESYLSNKTLLKKVSSSCQAKFSFEVWVIMSPSNVFVCFTWIWLTNCHLVNKLCHYHITILIYCKMWQHLMHCSLCLIICLRSQVSSLWREQFSFSSVLFYLFI